MWGEGGNDRKKTVKWDENRGRRERGKWEKGGGKEQERTFAINPSHRLQGLGLNQNNDMWFKQYISQHSQR